MSALSKIAILLVFAALLYTCKKPSEASPIPQITFKQMTLFGKDSAEIVIAFKDGDGDIGLNDNDTFPPFDKKGNFYENLFLTYYYKDSTGIFHAYDIKYPTLPIVKDTLKFAYRIPNLTPTGQNKLLDGDIKVKIKPIYFQPPHKIIRYDIVLYDRSLHKSNVVSTSEKTVP